MANFLLVADPDSDRRARFVRGVRTRLPPLDGLRTAECAAGDVQLLWAAADSAPISTAADGDGVAVLWGEAIAGPDARRIGAPEVARAWAETPSRIAAPWDGLYAAAVCRAHRPGVVVVGADLLGLFPIYFYGTPELLLVASSPELFRHHPAFRPELDTAGLVGLLLTAGIVQGRTLWRDVRRLAPGHLLFWEPRAEPQEVSQYALPASDRFFGLPFGAQVNLLYDAWDAAHDTPAHDSLEPSTDEAEARTATIAGSPDEVIEGLRVAVDRFADRSAGLDLVVRLHYPGIAFERAARAVELFAEHVIPVLAR